MQNRKALTTLISRSLLFASLGIKSNIFNKLIKIYISIIFLYHIKMQMFSYKIAYHAKDENTSIVIR